MMIRLQRLEISPMSWISSVVPNGPHRNESGNLFKAPLKPIIGIEERLLNNCILAIDPFCIRCTMAVFFPTAQSQSPQQKKTRRMVMRRRALELTIPILDLKAQFESLREPILKAIEGVLNDHHFILGPNVEALESEVAAFCGCRFGI